MSIFGKKKKEVKGVAKYSYRDFLTLLPVCTDECREKVINHLNACERPRYFGDKEVMKDLNGITYGQLDDLSRITKSKDPIVSAITILMDLKESEIYGLPVEQVFGFRNFVVSEVDRINNLFASISIDHTPEELSAGIDQLNFGSFGVLDWYARRMRISNQNDVRSVPWVRIYMCMKNDTAQVAYERRYNQVVLNKAKSKRR